MKNILFSIIILFVVSIIFIGCETDSNIVEQESNLSNVNENTILNKNLQKNATKKFSELTSAVLQKELPEDNSIQAFEAFFRWSQADYSIYYSPNTWYFSKYEIEVNGSVVFETSSRIKLSSWVDLSYAVYTPGTTVDYQVYAVYYNGGTSARLAYDSNEEWQITVGLETPVISGSWDNNHPKISWDPIPNAEYYLVYSATQAAGPYTIILPDNPTLPYLIDSRYIKGNFAPTRNIYYRVQAARGGCFSGFGDICVISDFSNVTSFIVKGTYLEE